MADVVDPLTGLCPELPLGGAIGSVIPPPRGRWTAKRAGGGQRTRKTAPWLPGLGQPQIVVCSAKVGGEGLGEDLSAFARSGLEDDGLVFTCVGPRAIYEQGNRQNLLGVGRHRCTIRQLSAAKRTPERPEIEPRGASGCTPAFSPRGKRDYENNYSAAKRRFNRVQRYIP